MSQLAQKFDESEFLVACNEARYLAKRYNIEMRVYHYAYSIRGGYYNVTTASYNPFDNETLIVTMHKI